MDIKVTEPGIYPDLSNDDYHADPVPGGSLSSSGARSLLECPAVYRHQRDHGRPNKAHYDIGHAAHMLVLGAGPDIYPVDAADWRTKAAKEEAEQAREFGMTPLLIHDA